MLSLSSLLHAHVGVDINIVALPSCGQYRKCVVSRSIPMVFDVIGGCLVT
jgi:hypothetical protein